MPLNFNRAPWFDDFDPTKGYYRTLMKPAFAVQARELNQFESVRQQQITYLGDSLYQHGTMVEPGQAAVDLTADYVRLEPYYGTINGQPLAIDPTVFNGQTIVGNTSGISAQVLFVMPATSTTADTLYVKYLDSGTDGKQTAFADGEPIFIKGTPNLLAETWNPVSPDTSHATGVGLTAQINDGVYYIFGYFVRVVYQYLVVNPYNNQGSARIGLQIIENIVTSDDDPSLLDNANGSPNYAAPGADRYQILLTLSYKDIADFSNDSNFVELVRVVNGQIIKLTDRTIYSQLAVELARRTADTNGDFTVIPFGLSMRESLDGSFVSQGMAASATAAVAPVTAVGATASATIVGGAITAINIIDGSLGYLSVPSVHIAGDGGGASATATVVGQVVTGIVVNTSGAGYSYAIVTVDPSTPANAGSLASIRLASTEPSTTDAYKGFQVYIQDGAGAGAVRQIAGYDGTSKAASVTADWDPLKIPDGTSSYVVQDLASANNGLYPPPPSSPPPPGNWGFEDQLAVGMESGKAYVNGYELKTLGTTFIPMDKARVTATTPNSVTGTPIGNYILCAKLFNFPIPAENNVIPDYLTITFYDEPSNGGDISGMHALGTARVRAVEFAPTAFFSGSSPSDTAAVYALYLFDIQMGDNDINYAKSFVCVDITGVNVLEGTAGPGSWGDLVTRFDVINVNGAGIVPAATMTQGSGITEEVVAYDAVNGIIYTRPTADTQVSGSGFATVSTTTFQIQDRLQIFDPVDNVALFPLAQSVIQSASTNLVYSVRRTLLFKSSDNNYTFNVDNIDEAFVGPTDTFVATMTDGANVGKFLALPTPVMGGTPAYSSMTFNIPAAGNSTVKLQCTVNKQSAVPKSKTLVQNETVAYATPTNTMSLYKADIYQLDSVVDASGNDITSRYSLNNGQTDNTYDTGSITLLPGQQAPTSQVVITYDYFLHGTGDCFTADSYLTLGDNATALIPSYTSASGVQYQLRDCLDFRSRRADSGGTGYGAAATIVLTGGAVTTINLGSGGSSYSAAPTVVIDAPGGVGTQATATCTIVAGVVTTVAITGAGSGYSTVPHVAFNPVGTGVSNYSGFGSGYSETPQPYGQARCDITYYLARTDKIYINQNGEFHIIAGTPSLAPVPPPDPKDGMLLYTVALHPYTLTVKDLAYTMKDNRRYTMADIGLLAQRISNLEYYTNLNQLEQTVSNMSITDASTGLDRFKNGFIVDNFKDFSVANVYDAGFTASLDRQNGQMRPPFLQDSVDLVLNTVTSQAYQQTGDMITLPYTNLAYITQPFATRIENVNPFAVFGWNGTLTLDPPSDTWFDVNQLPDVLVNDDVGFAGLTVGQWSSIAWNDWQTDWTGQSTATNVSTSTSTQTQGGGGNGNYVIYTSQSNADRLASWQNRGLEALINDTGLAALNDQNTTIAVDPSLQGYALYVTGDGGQTITSTATTTNTTTTTTTDQSRTGTQSMVIPETVQTVISGQTLSQSMIPYMRNKTIDFIGKGFKPNTRLYAFFDSVAVSGYVKPTMDPVLTPTLQNGNYNDPLYSNGVGNVTGTFNLPDNSTLSFRCGSKTFRLVDDSANGLDADSWGDATYTAMGVLDDDQTTITSVRVPEVITQSATDSRVLTSTSTASTTSVTSTTTGDPGGLVGNYVDPVSETFLIDINGGVFVTKVDVFFQSIDPNLPVTCQIRTVDNGYPGATVVPFGECTLYPNAAGGPTTSQDASVPTTFVFPSPVYLNGGTEYALTILANSTQYLIYTAKMGEGVIGGNSTVSQQPYNGVFFVSQNASAWTAVQDEDMKFTIYRAQFATNAPATVIFNNDVLPSAYLDNLAFQTLNLDNTVRVYHSNHCMPTGQTHLSTVQITVPPANLSDLYNGIPASALNGSFQIANVTLDSYTITLSGTSATSSGRCGPVAGTISVTQNRQYDLIQPVFGQMVLPPTTTTWTAKTVTGKSPNNNAATSQEPYVMASGYDTALTMTDNNYFNAPCMVCSALNETTMLTGAKSLGIQCQMLSPVDSLSPVIDLTRTSAIVVNNRIDDPTFANTTINNIDAGAQVNSASPSSQVDFVSVDNGDGTYTNQIYQTGGGTSLDFSVFRVGRYVTIAGYTANDCGFGDPALILAVSPTTLTLQLPASLVALGAAWPTPVGDQPGVQITQYDRYTSEIAPLGSTTAARYLTRQFTLQNPANSLQLYITAVKPPGAFIDVYYRILYVDTNNSFADQPYALMTVDPSSDISDSQNNTDYKDYLFTADNLGKFGAFAIKVVMRGGNSSRVPLNSGLRGIALAV